MVEVDGHAHFVKPENASDRYIGRDTSPWLNFDYRGKALGEFAAEHPEYEGNAMIAEIMLTLQFAAFPTLPHVVDKMYLAKKGGGHPEKLVLLTIDYPGSPTPTHEEMLRLVEAFPEQIIGSVSVDPNRGNAAAVLQERLKALVELNEKLGNGWRPVVKFHPISQKFNPGNLGAKELGRMYSAMEEIGAVLVTHTGVFQTTQVDGDIVIADPARLTAVAEKHPNLRIVLAHMGTPDIAVVTHWERRGVPVRHFEHALEMVGKYPNVYGDMGGLLWTGDRPAGAYGACECKNYDFGDRAQYAFSRVNGILEMERNSMYRTGLRAFGLGKNQLIRKLIYGSDFPVTRIDDLRKQEKKLGFNPARNTAKVFART
jgi:predicted TIM-barrel fold metal-dependent hydrolase